MSKSAEFWRRNVAGVLQRREPVTLGPATSAAYRGDPRMLAFMAARYKFAAKMLEGMGRVLEVGCGDAFGAPIVAQVCGALVASDVDGCQLKDNERRCVHCNVEFAQHDFVSGRWRGEPFDGAFAVDVLEHIAPGETAVWMRNIVEALTPEGVLLLGTPNVTAQAYASRHSVAGHINLHSHDQLRALGRHYFANVFMFGMNDETLHTGFGPMAQYLWALCVGPNSTRGPCGVAASMGADMGMGQMKPVS